VPSVPVQVTGLHDPVFAADRRQVLSAERLLVDGAEQHLDVGQQVVPLVDSVDDEVDGRVAIEVAVREWVEDRWHGSYADDGTRLDDGSAWTANPSGSFRVIRGGSFVVSPDALRAAARSYDTPSDRDARLGCRCLRPFSP